MLAPLNPINFVSLEKIWGFEWTTILQMGGRIEHLLNASYWYVNTKGFFDLSSTFLRYSSFSNNPSCGVLGECFVPGLTRLLIFRISIQRKLEIAPREIPAVSETWRRLIWYWECARNSPFSISISLVPCGIFACFWEVEDGGLWISSWRTSTRVMDIHVLLYTIREEFWGFDMYKISREYENFVTNTFVSRESCVVRIVCCESGKWATEVVKRMG